LICGRFFFLGFLRSNFRAFVTVSPVFCGVAPAYQAPKHGARCARDRNFPVAESDSQESSAFYGRRLVKLAYVAADGRGYNPAPFLKSAVPGGPSLRRPPDLFLSYAHWTAPLAVALLVRVVAVVVLAGPTARPTAYEHGVIAENLLAGRGFSVWFLGTEGPTSQQAPFVPCLLAGCYWLFGVGTSAAHIAFQLLQCLAGTAVVAVAALWARRLFSDRPGIAVCVAWCGALYPPHVYMVTHIQAAVWSTLAAVSLLCIAAGPTARRPLASVGFGLLAGWSVLIDPILALVVAAAAFGWLVDRWRGIARVRVPICFAVGVSCFFIHLPMMGQLGIGFLLLAFHLWGFELWGERSKIKIIATFRFAGLSLACAAALVGPWLVRNYQVHGEFVFVKTSFGYAFWQGNNERSWGTDKIPKLSAAELAQARSGTLAEQNRALWEARHETLYIDDVLLKPAGYREFAGLSEPARSRLLGDRAQSWIAEHPADYARLCLKRLGYFLLWDRTNPKAAHPVYQASSVVWLALAGIGLLAARKHWKRLAPSIGAFAAVALFHTLTITSVRFRIPVEPIGLVWGAVGLSPAVTNVASRIRDAWRSARRPPPPVDRGTTLRGPHARPARRAATESTRRAG
jgi:hypothetical protein